MNTQLRKKARNDFEKDFFKLINNSVCGTTIKNAKKHRDIKLVTKEKRRNYLVSEPNYHSTKFFTENLLAVEMRKTQIFMNKPSYLTLSILQLRKMVIHEFWYDYIKLKNKEKAKLCYMERDSFIADIKTAYIYKDIVKYV